MGTLVFFLAISIIFSFLCSIWEAVMLSIPPSFVEIKLQEKVSWAPTLKAYKDEIDRPLAGILTLNTLAHTVGAMGVGAEASRLWGGEVLMEVFGFSLTMEAMMAVITTLAILIFSEIIPKTIGANFWRSLVGFTVNSLRVIIVILYPLVWLSQQITKLLKKDKKKSVLSRADFSAMTEIGIKQGIFKDDESSILRNLLKFDTITAKSIMTPRTVVKAAQENKSIREFYDDNKKLRFSRIPIYSKTNDEITGFVLKDEVLSNIIDENGTAPLKDIVRKISVVNEHFPLPKLFTQFLENREHIALVVDDFGGMAGLVTMEDVIETLIGLEIVDEFDNTEDMQSLARKQWEVRAKRLGLIDDEE